METVKAIDPTQSLDLTQGPSNVVPPVAPGPANPQGMKKRKRGTLSKLPEDCDALEAFKRIRRQKHLSDEAAFMNLIMNYDVSLLTANEIHSKSNPLKTPLLFLLC